MDISKIKFIDYYHNPKIINDDKEGILLHYSKYKSIEIDPVEAVIQFNNTSED